MKAGEILRWIVFLPFAAGVCLLVAAAGGFASHEFPKDSLVQAGIRIVLEAFLCGLAVYLGAKVSPSPRVAPVLAALVVVGESVSLVVLFREIGSKAFTDARLASSLAGAVAAVASAWMFARIGRSGFRQRWPWFAFVLPVAAVVFVLFSLFIADRARDSARPSLSSASALRRFQSDGLSFSYPADWKLTAGRWEEWGRGRRRETDLKGPTHEFLTIRQLQPATDVSLRDLFHGFGWRDLTSSAKPTSESMRVGTIAGETVAGLQLDLDLQYLMFKIPSRFCLYKLQRKGQTLIFATGAAVKDLSAAEPRFQQILESVSAD